MPIKPLGLWPEQDRPDPRKWWAQVAPHYPFHAITPTTIKPNKVAGSHASYVYRQGWRKWGWRTAAERDAFVLQYHAKAVS